MTLSNTIRFFQRLVGLLLLALGIYLIFGAQEFFGTILVIVAFLVFPNIRKKQEPESNVYDQDSSSEHHCRSYDGWDAASGNDSEVDKKD